MRPGDAHAASQSLFCGSLGDGISCPAEAGGLMHVVQTRTSPRELAYRSMGRVSRTEASMPFACGRALRGVCHSVRASLGRRMTRSTPPPRLVWGGHLTPARGGAMTWRNCSTPPSPRLTITAPRRSQPARTAHPMPSTNTQAVPVGAAVYSHDGRRLGVVKAIRHGCFLVDVRFAFDYWLPLCCVALVTAERVVLAIAKRDLPHYLVDIDCPADLDALPPLPSFRLVETPSREHAVRWSRALGLLGAQRRAAGWAVSRSSETAGGGVLPDRPPHGPLRAERSDGDGRVMLGDTSRGAPRISGTCPR
jgi:hypothetical protein